ncbi:MAG: hypothetical protein KKC68_05850, partial [Candidatus Thermoplasmatota archaeon]|nr:hypothetical protein [Candidatus Thermoplasmatota archaeon]
AVSGMGKDRDVLKNFLTSQHLPHKYLSSSEWQNISAFSEAWADKDSLINNKVQCFWLEFDMPDDVPDVPVPSVFFGPVRLPNGISSNEIDHYEWLVESALPLLKGRELSGKMKHQIHNCIMHIPQNASLFQIGTMLSRESKGVRLHISKFDPMQIIPYLEAIGWKDENNELTVLIGELADKADRFVISYDVTEDGIGPRIGIELSFTQDIIKQSGNWNSLFSFFVKKGWCIPEKCAALLKYPGSNDEEILSGAIMNPVVSAAGNLDTLRSSRIFRYISHVKLVYRHGEDVEVKAYPAVRLFSNS